MKNNFIVINFIIFLASILFSLSGMIIKTNFMLKKLHSYITVFSGGLQLSTILVDIIPHMNDSHSHSHSHHSHSHSHSHNDTPWILSGIIFILLLAVDILLLHKKNNEHNNNHNHNNNNHNHIGTCNTSVLSSEISKSKALIFIFGISLHSFFVRNGY